MEIQTCSSGPAKQSNEPEVLKHTHTFIPTPFLFINKTAVADPCTNSPSLDNIAITSLKLVLWSKNPWQKNTQVDPERKAQKS